MTDEYDEIGTACHAAWAAYIDQAVEEQGWPDSEATRRRAFAYYEEELAKKNAAKKPSP